MAKSRSKSYKNEKLVVAVGLRIRENRIARKISQEALAFKCEVDYSQINRMELGKVNFTVSSLSRVADALQMDLKDLLP